ncbi:MAG: tRNA pseudouridine(13) synthase TruD [Patescibacteria group bacterium]|nr:tRNA pseudouridine(13) synthase TruD [Patescibacteria group bacterium]
MSSLSETWLKEKETLENYKKIKPKSFITPSLSEKEMLSQIGINIPLPERPKGYIRFYFQDFIVEEVSKKGEILGVEPEEEEGEISPSFPFHCGANLVKVGISTFDALNLLANSLQMKVGRITYAGLKDLNALTSQKIVFLDLNQEIFEKIKKLSLPDLFLNNFSIEKKGLLRGELFGNRFSLFLRTEKGIDEKLFSKNVNKIKEEGFLNFYSVQRFGTPRFISHILGKLILQGKYEEVVFNFLTNLGLQEIPLLNEKRKKAKEYFGDWKKIEETFLDLPFTFRNELQLLSYLKENPQDFIGALVFLKDQTKFWTYSYASHLFNQILSLKGLELPEEIPLLLSDNPVDRKVYEFWLEKDETEYFTRNIRPFRFIKLQRRFVRTRVIPKDVLFKALPEGVAISFTLEKGVYATTFLMNLFQAKEALPLPEWVKEKEYDTKEVLGIGSIDKTKKIFKKILSSPIQK